MVSGSAAPVGRALRDDVARLRDQHERRERHGDDARVFDGRHVSLGDEQPERSAVEGPFNESAEAQGVADGVDPVLVFDLSRNSPIDAQWRLFNDWCDLVGWLQEDPDTSAVASLGRLQETEPDRFSRAHLRTLQRRVQQWRGIMADKLVYAASEATLPDPDGMPEIALTSDDPK